MSQVFAWRIRNGETKCSLKWRTRQKVKFLGYRLSYSVPLRRKYEIPVMLRFYFSSIFV